MKQNIRYDVRDKEKNTLLWVTWDKQVADSAVVQHRLLNNKEAIIQEKEG